MFTDHKMKEKLTKSQLAVYNLEPLKQVLKNLVFTCDFKFLRKNHEDILLLLFTSWQVG